MKRPGAMRYGAALAVFAILGVLGMSGIATGVYWLVQKPPIPESAIAALRIADVVDLRKAEKLAIAKRVKAESEYEAKHGKESLKAIPHAPDEHPPFASEVAALKKTAEKEEQYAQFMTDGIRLFKNEQPTLAKEMFSKAREIADTQTARDAYLAAEKLAAEYARGNEARRGLPATK